jgi:hypothetical protein
MVSLFTYPSSPIDFLYCLNTVYTPFLLSFKFIDTENEYSLNNLHNEVNDENLRAVVYCINVLTSNDWKIIANKIDHVIFNRHNKSHHIPCFIIGTKFIATEAEETPCDVAMSYSEIFGTNISSETSTTPRDFTRIIETSEVLNYVDHSKSFELYLETEYGLYCSTDDYSEVKTVLEPVIRSIARVDHEKYKREYLTRRRSKSSSILQCFIPGSDSLDDIVNHN